MSDSSNKNTEPTTRYELWRRADSFGPAQKVGEYSSKKRANTARDKKDNAYGAYAHSIRPVTR